MRKVLLSLLLATTIATPAFARPPKDKDDDRSSSRVERSSAPKAHARTQARAERPQVRQQRTQQVQRSAESPRTAVRGGAGLGERSAAVRNRNVDIERRANVNQRGRPTLQARQQTTDSVTNWRERQRATATHRQTAPAQVRPNRPATQTAQHYGSRPEWRTNWRNDHRYDWRNYRNHNRSVFRLGVYFDPFGSRYRRYNIGWRLQPSYYSSNYWLNDPYMYRLPYAPWPYKWVRYYDDALLVDTMTGQVVDVMYQFFW